MKNLKSSMEGTLQTHHNVKSNRGEYPVTKRSNFDIGLLDQSVEYRFCEFYNLANPYNIGFAKTTIEKQ